MSFLLKSPSQQVVFFSISSLPEQNYSLFPKWAGHGTSVTHIGEIIKCKGGGEIIKCKGGDGEGTRAVWISPLLLPSATVHRL